MGPRFGAVAADDAGPAVHRGWSLHWRRVHERGRRRLPPHRTEAAASTATRTRQTAWPNPTEAFRSARRRRARTRSRMRVRARSRATTPCPRGATELLTEAPDTTEALRRGGRDERPLGPVVAAMKSRSLRDRSSGMPRQRPDRTVTLHSARSRGASSTRRRACTDDR